jgi:hypothetical protein
MKEALILAVDIFKPLRFLNTYQNARRLRTTCNYNVFANNLKVYFIMETL